MATDSEDWQPASPVAWVALTVDCPNEEVQERLCQFYSSALGGEVVAGAVRARGGMGEWSRQGKHYDTQPPWWFRHAYLLGIICALPLMLALAGVVGLREAIPLSLFLVAVCGIPMFLWGRRHVVG